MRESVDDESLMNVSHLLPPRARERRATGNLGARSAPFAPPKKKKTHHKTLTQAHKMGDNLFEGIESCSYELI